MDCRQARQHISTGEHARHDVRQHLSECSECQEFHERLQKTEALVTSAIPFSAPPALTQRLLAMVPQAALELQAQAAARAGAREIARRVWLRQVFYLMMALVIGLGLVVWFLVLGPLQTVSAQIWGLIPLLPMALEYWGRQLQGLLAPFYDVLQLAALFTLLALVLEYALRTVQARTVTAKSRR